MDICLGDNMRFDNEFRAFCYNIFSDKKINDILLINFAPLRIDKIVGNTIYFILEEEHISKLIPLFEIIDDKIRECIRIKKINTNKFTYASIKSLVISGDKYLRLTFNPRKKMYDENDIINCVLWVRNLIIEEKDNRIFTEITLY